MIRPSREECLVETAFVWAKRSTCSRLQVGAVFHRDGRILMTGYNGAPSGLPHCDHRCDCGKVGDRLRAPDPTNESLADWSARKFKEVGASIRASQMSGISVEDTPHKLNCNSLQPCIVSEHAERNGIAWAARLGVGLEGSELVVTHQPCLACAMSIINVGVTRVTYVYPYRLRNGLDLLEQAGLPVEQYLDWEEPTIVG